ncbi:MAG TPA: cation transporter [Ignavibacteria bacterium]|nr:cation transporter [Ignavibacteria bacterium]
MLKQNLLKLSLFSLIIISSIVYFTGCGKQETNNGEQNQLSQKEQTQSKPDSYQQTQQKTENSHIGSEKHVHIKVSTMQCGTCQKNIESAVKKVNGVIEVKVDKDEKVAHVEFDDSKTDLNKIENAITSAGYDANDKKADPTAYKNLDNCCKLPKDQ